MLIICSPRCPGYALTSQLRNICVAHTHAPLLLQSCGIKHKTTMSKTILIELSEAEYNALLQNYVLGNLIAHEVNEPSREELMLSADIVNKLCKVGYTNKLKGFKKLHEDLYSFPQNVEDTMLEAYEEFIEYVSSGARDEDFEAMKQQIDEMRKQGLV